MIPLWAVPYAVAAVATVGALGYSWWAVDQAEDALSVCASDKRTLQAALDRQNAAVTVMATAASQAQETARQALATATQVAKQRTTAAEELEGLILAAKSQDCGPALQEIRRGLKP